MKQYFCKKVKRSSQLDGQINKPEWANIEEISLVENVTGDSPQQSTKIKLAWDDNYIYVAYYCEDTERNATLTGYNDKLYDEEVVEIFIDDNNDLKTYMEIEVNPLNAILHYHIFNDLNGKFYAYARTDEVILSTVMLSKENSDWGVEIAIPLSEFVSAPNNPPKDGDSWLFNLYRIDRPRSGQDEYSAWIPTGKINFHIPQNFGQLIFVE